jgi:hypothetical protein
MFPNQLLAGIVGYDVKIAVDTQHHLIVAAQVTNVGSDRNQLSNTGCKEPYRSDQIP